MDRSGSAGRAVRRIVRYLVGVIGVQHHHRPAVQVVWNQLARRRRRPRPHPPGPKPRGGPVTVRDITTSDQLITGIGAASGMTFGTFAVIAKFDTVASDRATCHLHNSGGTWLASGPQCSSGSTWMIHDGGTAGDPGVSISTGTWYLCVARKATGNQSVWFSVYNFTSTTWTHGNTGATTLLNWTSPGSGGTVQFSFQAGSGDQFDGRVAARALWSNTLPWTADAAGNTAIASAGLETSATN